MAIIALALGFALCPLLIGLIQNYGYANITPLAVIMIMIILSGALFFIFRSFMLRRFDKPIWIAFSAIYLALMIAALFLKGQGRGLNLDIRDFFGQWSDGSYNRAFLIGNCLAFVPYPLLLHFWGIKTKPWRAFLIFAAIESIQFVFSLGTFDVVDLICYIAGYLAGYVILIFCIKIGVQPAYNC